jgi:hypothetical protein
VSRLIKEIRDGSIVEFDRGVFDDWCVYLSRPNENKFAPKDIQYFTELKNLGEKYGNEKVYNDFVKFYQKTTNTINKNVNELITELSIRNYVIGRRPVKVMTWSNLSLVRYEYIENDKIIDFNMIG